MSLSARNLTLIRAAIDDTGGTTWDDDEIADIYESLNSNLPYAVAHLLLSKAMALTQPTAPTIPTLDDAPTTSMAMWDKKSSLDLNLFQQELALYREEVSHIRTQVELLRAQAQIYIDIAKGGGVL